MTDPETIARVGIEPLPDERYCAMVGGSCRDEFPDMRVVGDVNFYGHTMEEVRLCSCGRLWKRGEDPHEEIIGTPRSAEQA